MKRFIETYDGQVFDILIIGGGITGATIAYEAALRGLSVALIEKNDFASATSAATSKMIHGGLRYLATGQFHLVRESLIERTILANIAPNFVSPLPFVFAIYDYMHTPRWMMQAGMTMYELLALGKTKIRDSSRRIPHFTSLTAHDTKDKFPFIISQGLKGGFLYYDCRNHFPERLTLAFIKSAIKYGAQVSNYVQMTDFLYEKTRVGLQIKGVQATDRLTGKKLNIKARLVVNAAGPWVDIVLSRIDAKKELSHIRRSEGIHIIVNRKFSDKFVLASQSPTGQHFFLIPFRGMTIIGTTDKEYKGDPDKYQVTKESVDELLVKVNSVLLPGQRITYRDIVYIYGGLRPLVEDSSTDVYNASRRYEIADEERRGIHGLISAEGGKFTTSRRLAEKVINLAFKKLDKPVVKSSSARRFLVTSHIQDLESFITSKQEEYPMFNQQQIRYLISSYGTDIDSLMELYLSNPDLQVVVNDDGENLAQVVYAIRHEMARTLTDIILRRTAIGWIGQPDDKIINHIAKIAARELSWSDDTIKEQIWQVKQKYNLVQTLKSRQDERKYDISA